MDSIWPNSWDPSTHIIGICCDVLKCHKENEFSQTHGARAFVQGVCLRTCVPMRSIAPACTEPGGEFVSRKQFRRSFGVFGGERSSVKNYLLGDGLQNKVQRFLHLECDFQSEPTPDDWVRLASKNPNPIAADQWVWQWENGGLSKSWLVQWIMLAFASILHASLGTFESITCFSRQELLSVAIHSSHTVISQHA